MIAADIFLDGFFAAVAAVGFGAVSDPPDARLPAHRPAGHRGTRPAVLPDELRRHGHRHGVALRRNGHRLRKPLAGQGHPLPDDGALHPGAAADGSGHLRLQDGLLAHHVPPVAQRPGPGHAVHAAVLPQRHRVVERHRPAGRRSHAADLRLQPPGVLAHAAQKKT